MLVVVVPAVVVVAAVVTLLVMNLRMGMMVWGVTVVGAIRLAYFHPVVCKSDLREMPIISHLCPIARERQSWSFKLSYG